MGRERGKKIYIGREKERERKRHFISENIQIDFPLIKYPVKMIHFLVLVGVGMGEGEAKIEIKRK